jgi:hypothetical protein
MWDGFANLSDISVGVELEGFHNVPFEEAQYRSLGRLLNQLKKRYAVEDRNVLEHYRIAYSKPNRFHSINARGRKNDPGMGNFDRLKAGLLDEYAQDPDVRAGRMIGSPAIMRAGGQVATQVEEAEDEEDEEMPDVAENTSPARLLRTGETAWKIAGVQYNSATTVYCFPNGAVFRGNEIKDWSDVPVGTKVRLGVPPEKLNLTLEEAVNEREMKVVSPHQAEVIVPEVTATLTPWKIANALHNSGVTFYIYPDGTIYSGNSLPDTARVPVGSKVLVAYRPLPRPKTRDKLGEDLEEIYMDPRTLYLFPDRTLKSGDQIQDFSVFPPEILVFAKIE